MYLAESHTREKESCTDGLTTARSDVDDVGIRPVYMIVLASAVERSLDVKRAQFN